MTATYAESAWDDVIAFLQDDTTGLAARAAAINTDMSDSLLPTTWHWPDEQSDEYALLLPAVILVWKNDQTQTPRRQIDQGVWYSFDLGLIVGEEDHQFERDDMRKLTMRLERALRECFDEVRGWSGHTLAGRVTDSEISRVDGEAVRLRAFGDRRCVVVNALLRVKKEASQQVG